MLNMGEIRQLFRDAILNHELGKIDAIADLIIDLKSNNHRITRMEEDYKDYEKSNRELILQVERGFSMMEERFIAIDKRFDAMDKRFEDLIHQIDKRFEDLFHQIDKRFEAVDKRFEDMNKRFEDMNRRFEDMNRRFEELLHQIDKRFEELFRYIDKRFEDSKYYIRIMMWMIGIGFTVTNSIILLLKALS